MSCTNWQVGTSIGATGYAVADWGDQHDQKPPIRRGPSSSNYLLGSAPRAATSPSNVQATANRDRCFRGTPNLYVEKTPSPTTQPPATLTMNFHRLRNKAAATWNAWLDFSEQHDKFCSRLSQPITKPADAYHSDLRSF